MKDKKWLKQYGIHIVICAVAIGIAFGVNQKINLDRSRIYSVSNGVYSILKMITKAEVNGNQLELQGWAFDTEIYNESSNCELILQDTETGEALWVKMDKNPAVVEIAERYTDGGDYSGARFGGNIKTSTLNEESVYEILVRYTTDYVDENGIEQQYVRTVSTDEFLYQGQMTEYNPKTFVAPEIAGTELEKELEGARLFHWFEEGMWVYYSDTHIYYIARKESIDDSLNLWLPCFWYVRDKDELPEDRKEYGFGLSTFPITLNVLPEITKEDYKVWITDIPSASSTFIETGLYDANAKQWLYKHKGQIGEVTNE